VPLGSGDFAEPLRQIRAAKPDVVFSSVNGGSNRALYRQYRAAGISARDVPILALSIAEAEVRAMGPVATTGHLASWAYFQSVDSPENSAFVRKFRNRFGDRRVTDDPMEAAYFQVHLWAQSVRKAGVAQAAAIRWAAAGQQYAAPEGTVRIDPKTRHTWKMARVGEIREDSQFTIVYRSEGPLDPRPWDEGLGDNAHCAG
jgi:urea transport system substrate-binding protein